MEVPIEDATIEGSSKYGENTEKGHLAESLASFVCKGQQLTLCIQSNEILNHAARNHGKSPKATKCPFSSITISSKEWNQVKERKKPKQSKSGGNYGLQCDAVGAAC